MASEDVVALALKFRKALEANDTAALNRIIAAYGDLYQRLQDKIELLVRDIADGELSAAEVRNLNRYKSLIDDMSAELTKFGNYTETELSAQANAAIERAQKDARALVSATVNGDAAIMAAFNRLPSNTIKQLLGFLQSDGPLFERLSKLGPETAKRVAQMILENVALGKNPKAYAGAIRDALGIGLSDALRMTRTVQMYAYREAARANYAANSDIIDGWIWYAELDESTCLSCIAQHGTVHDLSETLNDHHNGRCAALPHIAAFGNPVTEGGQAWFDALSEAEKKAMMGEAKYKAYQDGKFTFEQLSTAKEDAVYGQMRTEASLKELIGE